MGAAALACSVPRAYQSPRTTPPGQISHSLAFEIGQGFFQDTDREEETLIAPEGYSPATYTLRVGLAERWEVAGSFGSLLLASEVKWNFLRSELVDAALAPRAQYYEPLVFSGPTRELVTLSLPLPIALNWNRELTLIASPTFAYAAGKRDAASDVEGETIEPAHHEHDFLAGGGLDLQLRANSKLAFQPGVTFYRRLSNGELRWQFGIAFSWGRMPYYGDVPP